MKLVFTCVLAVFGVIGLANGNEKGNKQAELRVLSYNAWLLDLRVGPFDLRRDARESAQSRLTLLKEEIGKLAPDVITFQEVWGKEYRDNVQELCESLGLSYTGYHSEVPAITPGIKLAAGFLGMAALAAALAYRGYQRDQANCSTFMRRLSIYGGGSLAAGTAGLGMALLIKDQQITRNFGNGLFVCSKYPIDDMDSFNFDDWTAFEEFGLYRSVVRAKIQVPNIGAVEVYSTHMGPVGFDQKSKIYDVADVKGNESQLNQLIQWIQKTRDPKSPMILAGDLNINIYDFKGRDWAQPKSSRYQQIIEKNGFSLKDSYGEVHGRPFPPPPNSWTDGAFNGHAFLFERVQEGRIQPDQVIDYIFYDGAGKMQAVDSRVVLNRRYAPLPPEVRDQYERTYGREFPLIPEAERQDLMTRHGLSELPLHLSDHFGVMTIFRSRQ